MGMTMYLVYTWLITGSYDEVDDGVFTKQGMKAYWNYVRDFMSTPWASSSQSAFPPHVPVDDQFHVSLGVMIRNMMCEEVQHRWSASTCIDYIATTLWPQIQDMIRRNTVTCPTAASPISNDKTVTHVIDRPSSDDDVYLDGLEDDPPIDTYSIMGTCVPTKSASLPACNNRRPGQDITNQVSRF